MLHTKTVADELLTVLHKLMELESLRDFRLVGGTALALQLGAKKMLEFFREKYPTMAALSENVILQMNNPAAELRGIT